MRITAHLDVELIAIETEDQVSVLVEFAAPPASDAGAAERVPGTLQVVLDRSGSMGGARITGARTALGNLVDRLDPRDNFGLVIFDTEIDVVVVPEAMRQFLTQLADRVVADAG